MVPDGKAQECFHVVFRATKVMYTCRFIKNDSKFYAVHSEKLSACRDCDVYDFRSAGVDAAHERLRWYSLEIIRHFVLKILFCNTDFRYFCLFPETTCSWCCFPELWQK